MNKLREKFPHRTSPALSSKRWVMNNLWTNEELQKFPDALKKHGRDWEEIRKEFFPNRNVSAILIKSRSID